MFMLTLTRMWHDRAISSWGMWILFSNWKKGMGMILRLKLFIWNLLCFRWRSTRFSSQKSPFSRIFSPYRTTISLNHRCVLHTLTLKLMIKSRSALPEDQKTFILLHSRLWISLEITSILDDYANRCINVFWCFSGKNRNINFVRFPAGMKLEMPMMFKFRDICDHIQLCRQLR